ncbi:hypothetical protein DFH09DRAFT_1074801 [Mycena vulgaris]|nr:hypothetical protein DFH09DRAFT_1074801 [Mycena vulgaris]
MIASSDLCEELALSEQEKSRNDSDCDGQDAELTFDPDFRLTDFSHGFRIFAFEDHTTHLPTKRYKLPQPDSTNHDVYLHTKIKHPGQANAEMEVMLLVRTKEDPDVEIKDSLLLSFLDMKVQPSFSTAILEGLLYVLRGLPQDSLLTVYCCSSFLGKALVTNRMNNANNPLGRNYDLIKAVVSTLQERTGRTCFKKVETNPAAQLSTLTPLQFR